MKRSTNSPTEDQKENTTQQQHTFKEEFGTLHHDLQAILQHAKNSGLDLTKDVGQDLWKRIESVAEKASNINQRVGHSAGDFLSHQFSKTKEKTQQYVCDAESTIKEHPLASVMISFSVGLLFSKVVGLWHSSH